MALRKVALLVQQLQEATAPESADANSDAAGSSSRQKRADTLAALAKAVVALCKEGGAQAQVSVCNHARCAPRFRTENGALLAGRRAVRGARSAAAAARRAREARADRRSRARRGAA